MIKRWLQGAELEKLKPTVIRGIATDINGHFYFSDETEAAAFGPFETYAECLTSLDDYVRYLG